MNKTILIISPFFSPNTGGVETHLDDLCVELSARGIEANVITYQPLTTRARGKNFERRGSVKIRRISWYGYNLFHKLEKYPLLELIYLFPGIFIYSLLFTIRHRKRIAAIHAHGMLASFAAKILRFLFRLRIIASTHAIYNFHQKPLLSRVIRYILSSFDCILAISEQSKKELMAIGINAGKIQVYKYWVDQSIFRPLNKKECKQKLVWQDKFVVLFVGRLLEIKGLRLLFQAAGLLKENMAIAIAGDGPLEAEVKQQARVNPRIIYLGRIENKLLNAYYNAADVVIVPSLYEEAFGRIILEALSSGTPVIAAQKGGIVEALTREVSMLIEPTVENIVSSINNFHQDYELQKNLSSRAREYALEHFSKTNAQKIIDTYQLP